MPDDNQSYEEVIDEEYEPTIIMTELTNVEPKRRE